MGRKCCVTECTSNYNRNDKISVFRLPKDPDERKRWIQCIPRDNIPDNSNTVVCVKHFPEGYECIKVNGKYRPKNPPSIFPNIPSSMVPTRFLIPTYQ